MPADQDWTVKADPNCAVIEMTEISDYEVKLQVIKLVARGWVKGAEAYKMAVTYSPIDPLPSDYDSLTPQSNQDFNQLVDVH